MLILLFILSVVVCLQLTLRIRMLPKESLGVIGIRVEIASWVMFAIVLLFKQNFVEDAGLALFIAGTAAGRIFSCSSNILGHPVARRNLRKNNRTVGDHPGRRSKDHEHDFENTVIS